MGLRVKILTVTALICRSVLTDHSNFGIWTRFKLTYSFPFFAFNYLTQCAVLGSTDGLRKRYSWFAVAWNTLGKTARSLILLENDFFPRKVLEFLEIVLEFYWRVLEYWNYSFCTWGQFSYFYSKYLSYRFFNRVPEMHCVAPPLYRQNHESVAWGVKFLPQWI